MIIVVTGGAGFIGSHLVKRLGSTSNVAKIIVIDTYKYGTSNQLDNSLFPDKELIYVNSDLCDMTSATLSPYLDKVDYLFHLAAEKYSANNSHDVRIIDTNIQATHRLYQEAAKAQIKKVIFTSSLYAYGRYHAPIMDESETVIPDTVYGISKLAGEHLLAHAARSYGLHYMALRLFFTYGPGVNPYHDDFSMGYRSVILKHFQRIFANELPLINGSGTQEMDYIYVDDVVDALMCAMESELSNHTVNIASGSTISINQLTDKILHIVDSPLASKFVDADWTDHTFRGANIALAKKILGWQPKTTIDAGLADIHTWMTRELP